MKQKEVKINIDPFAVKKLLLSLIECGWNFVFFDGMTSILVSITEWR